MDTEIIENKDELRAQLDQDTVDFLMSGGKIEFVAADQYQHDAAKLNRKQWLAQAKAQTHARHYANKPRGGV